MAAASRIWVWWNIVMHMKWDVSLRKMTLFFFFCLVFAYVTCRYFILWDWDLKNYWSQVIVEIDLWTWGKILDYSLGSQKRPQAPPCLQVIGKSLYETKLHILSPTPLQSPWGFALRFCSLKGSIWVAGAHGLMLSRIIKSSQSVTCVEAHQWISPVSSVQLEHNKSKLWQILIISFPTTFFSWPLFYSDSRSILGTTQAVIQSMYIVPCISQHVPPW